MRIRSSSIGTATLVALLLLASVAPAVGDAVNNCVGGGRLRPDEGGIGGTGVRPAAPNEREDEGGIGGTGIVADSDTGIIGTITGFASICVGGTEIHYGPQSIVEVDGVTASTAELAVGQVVEVVASGTGSEVWAQRISVRHILEGPVTRVDAERNELEIIGQTVQLLPGAVSPNAKAEGVVAGFAPGDFVRVSGLRREDGLVVASHAKRTDARLARLTGPVTSTAPGFLTVGGTAVQFHGDVDVAVGDEVRVSGDWNGKEIAAGAIETTPRVPFGGRVHRVEIEGYSSRTSAGHLKVGPFVLELSKSVAPESLPRADARIRVSGVVRNRRVVVERVGRGDFIEPPDGRGQVPVAPRGDGGKPMEQPDRGGRSDAPPPPHQDSRPGGRVAPPRINRQAPQRPERPRPPDRPPRPYRPERPERPPRPDRPERPRP